MDCTTGLTFDPKILTRNGDFVWLAAAVMLCLFCDREDIYEPHAGSESSLNFQLLYIMRTKNMQ